MIRTSLFILFLPLASFIIQIFLGKRLPRKGDFVPITAVLTTLVLSISQLVFMISENNPGRVVEKSWEWINLGTFHIELGILIDNITIVMLVVVALVSSLVHIYSVGYMADDPRYSRYFAYLSLFTFSMNGIVISNNMVSTYMFWELVGLSSYLLIGFWFEKDSASNAAKKAFIVNRIGDIGMFIGIMIFLQVGGTVLYSAMFHAVQGEAISGTLLTIAGICLFMGAVGKSAQFPLHVWLPDAMEGPTPVSALIHAATMVAAGVYLIVRLFPLFTPDALTIIAYVGGFTAIFSATIAVTQNDIKRVLAYSTVSQLGYMVLSVGTGAYIAGFFHLVTHAAFKACLFLCSGSVIHAMHHSLHSLHDHHTDAQDMRNMGGLKEKMPATYWTMLLSTVAISGIPLTSGFLSKDAILAGTLSFVVRNPQHILLAVFGFCAALLTAFYMFRMIFMTFHGKPENEEVFHHVHESPVIMTTPLVILSTLSFFIFYTLPFVNPFSDEGWFTNLLVAKDSFVVGMLSSEEILEGVHHSHLLAMVLSLLVAMTGILFAVLMYYKKKISPNEFSERFPILYKLSFHKYFIDEIYGKYLVKSSVLVSKAVGYFDWDVYDAYIVNGFGKITKFISRIVGIRLDYDVLDQQIVDGVGKTTSIFGKSLRLVQTGKLQNYLVWVLLGILVIFITQTM